VQMSENNSATWLQNEFGTESRFDRLSDHGPVEATRPK